MRLSRPAPFCLLLCASPLRCRRQTARCTGDKGTIAVDKSCHLPLWKQVPRLHLALTVEANVVRLCIAILDRAMKITFAGCVLLTIFSLSAPSRPSDSWIHESKLLALENAWNQAQLHHDSKALDSLVSRSEEHTSELQSRFDLVCRLLLEKKNDRTK